jgi:hypothetical protein
MTDRYATNSFSGVKRFEGGLFNKDTVGVAGKDDNPSFLYPPKSLKNAANGTSQKVQRGYMRMITSGFNNLDNLAKRRLHFQFNPDSIVRSVTARNDVQFWMNQDPSQLMQPIPGDANFAFELLFNREPEVVSGTYSDNGVIRESLGKAELPLTGAGDANAKTKPVPHKAVTDIGVLSDLLVFDEIIGQGINTKLIKQILDNAQKRDSRNNTSRGSTSDKPVRTATLKVEEASGGVITKVKIETYGAGYTSAPLIEINNEGTGGSGLALEVTILNGVVGSVEIVSGGSGYNNTSKFPKITLTGGGGGGNASSSSGTSDSEDDELPPFDYQEAQTNLYNNFGNSAFLVSTPIRIVFSSLFMVEGFVTSTMVTFNKFNANMVPTQCSVGITMQAMYIGFARKDTFLTLSLNKQREEFENGVTPGTGAGVDAPFVPKRGQELTAVQRLGQKLFKDNVGKTTRTGRDTKPSISVQQFFDQGDYTQTLGFRLSPTQELADAVKNGSIKKLEQLGTINMRYMGNSAGPTSIGNGTIDIGTSIISDLKANSEFNIKNLKNTDGELVVLKFSLPEGERLDVGETLDTTAGSKYEITYQVLFKIHTTNGETLVAGTYYSLSVTRNYNTTTILHDRSYLKTTYYERLGRYL